MDRTTILIRNLTRERLKQTGRKEQTYDDLINELIDAKASQDLLDSRFASLKYKRIAVPVRVLNPYEPRKSRSHN